MDGLELVKCKLLVFFIVVGGLFFLFMVLGFGVVIVGVDLWGICGCIGVLFLGGEFMVEEFVLKDDRIVVWDDMVEGGGIWFELGWEGIIKFKVCCGDVVGKGIIVVVVVVDKVECCDVIVICSDYNCWFVEVVDVIWGIYFCFVDGKLECSWK